MVNIRQLAGQHFDEYELKDIIGTGGMSAVYRAYQEELDRNVAVKVLSGELAAQAGYDERFRREAKMAASLEHAHIVPVYDFGTANDVAYVVMRLLSGGTLGRWRVEKARTSGEIVTLVRSIAAALDYAHSRGIIHRDIKPSNIMFDDSGTPYLVDFGIAKAINTDVSLTTENVVLGTPQYMAPEQWQTGDVTAAVDQYALAAVIYSVFTGKLPFDAPTPHQLMYQHLNETPMPAHTVNLNLPMSITSVLDKGMAKQATERYPSVSAFAKALENALDAQSSTATVPVVRIEASATVPSESPVARITVQSKKPATETVPSLKAPTLPPPAPQPATPVNLAPQPTPAPEAKKEMGSGTMMMYIGAGGGIGLALLVVVAIVAAVGLFYTYNLGRPDSRPPAAVPTPTLAAVAGGLATTAPTITPLPQSSTAPVQVGTLNPANLREVVRLHNRPETPVRDADISVNGAIASGHGDGSVRLWRDGIHGAAQILSGHNDVVNALVFYPDGSQLVTASNDGTIRLWNADNGTLLRTLRGHSGAVRDVAISPNGNYIASVGEDGTLRTWNARTGEPFWSIRADDRALAVAFSTEGGTLATGGNSPQVKLWQVANGIQVSNLSGHSESIRGVAFSPDGRYIASSSTDDTIRIWDATSGLTTQTLIGHNNDVWTVTFSPDSRLLASGGRNNSMRIWDVATGETLNTQSFGGWVLGINFDPFGTSIITASGDGTVLLWGN